MMGILFSGTGVNFGVCFAANQSFGGLGKAGLITIIVVSIILIVTTVWLINGTKKRD
jgi:hypothetical protein